MLSVYEIAMLFLTIISSFALIFFDKKNINDRQKEIGNKVIKYLLLAFVLCNMQLLLSEIFGFFGL